MKASRLATLIVILAVLSSLAVSAISLAALDELLVNGGFEDDIDSDGVPDAWSTHGGNLIKVNSPVNSGEHAAEFTACDRDYFYQVVPVQPGATYNFSGWAIKNDDNIENIFIRISFVGDPISYTSISLTGTDNEYRHLGVSAAAPPGVNSAKLEAVLWLSASDATATAYFDHMSFEGPPPPTPTPTPTPTLT
ncbi:unnamed protein product, partial [marine sediment metagenome]